MVLNELPASLLHLPIAITWQKPDLHICSHNSFRIAFSSYMRRSFCLRDCQKHFWKMWRVHENKIVSKNWYCRSNKTILWRSFLPCACTFCKFNSSWVCGWILSLYFAFGSKLKFRFLFYFAVSWNCNPFLVQTITYFNILQNSTPGSSFVSQTHNKSTTNEASLTRFYAFPCHFAKMLNYSMLSWPFP